MEFYSVTKKNEISSFAGKWMELGNIILSEVSQAQKAKGCMFSWYVEYRPKAYATLLWNISNNEGRLPTEGTEQGKETKNLNEVDVLTVQ
jgi:hypothetical protein